LSRNSNKRRRPQQSFAVKDRKINGKVRMKLVWVFIVVILALVGLIFRITYINAVSGEKYRRQVLAQSQQQYESRVIPFQRGDIYDANGTLLANSEKVYNVILDCKVINSREIYVDPTVKAIVSVLGIAEEEIRQFLDDDATKGSQYLIIKRQVDITEKRAFEEYCDVSDEEKALSQEEISERQKIKGVWFEEEYLRKYPLNSVGANVIGFAYSGDVADWGLEGYYSNVLNGINGRQYGYFNSDADVEQTIIEAKSGYSIISTIDVNIQSIIEKRIREIMVGLSNGPHGKRGAKNMGIIVANPNDGSILGMASSDPYDLNNPRDLTPFFEADEIASMTDEEKVQNLNQIWQNYCISSVYEPGSTAKAMTIGAALDSGWITPEDRFYCDGFQEVAGEQIKCSSTHGHGDQSLTEVMANSCNDALMQMASKMGVEEFVRYQSVFNIGSKTGIDLPGEASGITYNTQSMGAVQLATCSFGQGDTCTMIQELAAVSSTINGGYYYQPRVVSRIVDSDGSVIENIEPLLLKQTVSEETSNNVREYMGAVVSPQGTGRLAKVDGYSMGGKTGTAQKIPRGNGKYVVSFIGFAPVEKPQVVVYVVIDEANVESQVVSAYSQYVYREVMKELLPYMGIFHDEETTGVNADLTLNSILSANFEALAVEVPIDDLAVPEPREASEEAVEGGNEEQAVGLTNDEQDLMSGGD